MKGNLEGRRRRVILGADGWKSASAIGRRVDRTRKIDVFLEILSFSGRWRAGPVRKHLLSEQGRADALVLAAKVFLVREKTELGVLAEKLKTFRVEQDTRVEEVDFSLTTEVKDLNVSRSTLEGTFAFDDVFVVKHRGKTVPIPRTYEAPFSFEVFKDRLFLTIHEKKSRANNIANEMSKALFMSLGEVVEARINPETLKKFHEENFDNTRIVFFD